MGDHGPLFYVDVVVSDSLDSEIGIKWTNWTQCNSRMKALTVLVVDDDTDFAQSFGDLIRFYGHEVREVSNASAALDAIESGSFDLIFLDIRMPGQSGLDVYPTLRERCPRACIVFSTAFIDDVDRRSNQDVLHAELLEKPSGINRLEQVIRRVAGEFELLLVGDDVVVRELHQALRHRGYQVLRARSINDAADTLLSASGDKVSVVVGYHTVEENRLLDLDHLLDEAGMALPFVCVNAPGGAATPSVRPDRIQQLGPTVSLMGVLDAIDRGAEHFVV